MKNIDIKSVLIGVLCTTLVFVIIGAKSQDKNLGDITVNSIEVVNNDGKVVVGLSSDEDGGTLMLYNNDGTSAAGLIAAEDGGGLGIFNNDGKLVAGLNAAENGGLLDIYNKHEKRVATLQANKNSDGLIGLYDRYGDFGWGESGKQ